MKDKKFVKVYENTNYIRIKYNILDDTIEKIFEICQTDKFKKIPIEKIIYNDNMICCFYEHKDHPHFDKFHEKMLEMFKLFSQYGLTSVIDNVTTVCVVVDLYSNNKVKDFKN